MNWKFVFAVLILALLMVFTIPLWKIGIAWLASKFSPVKPVSDYVNRT